MGDKDFDNFNLQIGEIIGMTLDGKAIYKFTELGTAKNVMFGESIFKDGDFVVNEFGSILILKEARDGFVFDHAYLPACGELTIDKVAGYGGIERHATEEEKQKMLDALAKKGKRWNAEKKCIEDIPKRKFKKGDKVRIKHGVSSKTHDNLDLEFAGEIGDLIGKTMTIDRYTDWNNYVVCNESDWRFHEDWLEPYEELKKGDLAIFWDDDKRYAVIKFYERSGGSEEEYFRHRDQNEFGWKNVIKFESKEQFEKLIKGEK